MAEKKLPDLGYDGLGDLTSILHNQGVSDLSWLSVDEEMYRESEALPKQNLDTIPELQTALSQEGDERVPQLVPLRPHVVVNQNPLDKPGSALRAASGAVRNQVARYIIAGLDSKSVVTRLQSEFGPEDLRAASADVLPVLDSRGLLGNVYIDASHFSRCHQDGEDRKFVAAKAHRALFVLAKDRCTNCVCNKAGICASFKKRIVDEVPFDSKTFAHYAVQLSEEKRLGEVRISSSMTDSERKEAIRSGFLRSPIAQRGESVQTVQHRSAVPSKPVTTEDVRSFWERRMAGSSSEEMPSPFYLRAAKLLTVDPSSLPTLSSSSVPEIRAAAREYGILGHTYVDVDAMGGCRETLKFVASHGLSPDFFLRRGSCGVCGGASDGACSGLGRCAPVVSSRPEPSRQLFESALRRAEADGRLTSDQVASAVSKVRPDADWATLIAQANLFRPSVDAAVRNYSGPVLATAHHGDPLLESEAAEMDPEEVRRSISHMMNTGLRGKKLQAAVLSRYSRSDLSRFPEIGRRLSAEDGIQGTYFIDPTAYLDYGRGCSDGSDRFRKRGAPHVLASGSCTGCVLQTAPGWCSKYSKTLVRHVPSEVRSATAQRRALSVLREPPPIIENPVEKYELGSAEMEIDMNGSKSSSVDISIPSSSVTE